MDTPITEMVKSYTSIRVEQKLHDDLDGIGKRHESMSDIIRRLFDFYQEHQK